MATNDWLLGFGSTPQPTATAEQPADTGGFDWTFGFGQQQEIINQQRAENNIRNAGSTAGGAAADANAGFDWTFGFGSQQDVIDQQRAENSWNPLTWLGGSSQPTKTPAAQGDGWSLFNPSSWFGNNQSQAGGPQPASTTDQNGFSIFNPGSWFGGGDAAPATQGPPQATGSGFSIFNPTSWFGGSAESSGQDAADTMIQAILAGQPAAEAVSTSLMDTWKSLFGGNSSPENKPGIFDAMGGITARLKDFAQRGTPAEQQAAQAAYASIVNLNPGEVTTDVVTGVKDFLTSVGSMAPEGRDRTNNTASITDTPLPDVSGIPAYPGVGNGGGGSSGDNLNNLPVSATTGGVMGALWSDNPLTITKVGVPGIIELETNTPLLKRSLILFGLPIPLSVLIIIIGLAVYYRKPLGKYFHKLIKK